MTFVVFSMIFPDLVRCRGAYITDYVLVNLGVCSSCAVGNNELVVTRN